MADYKEFRYTTENPSHLWTYLKNPLLSLLSKDENTCILDLGCGNGYLVKQLVALGFNAYGIDASVSGINFAKQTHPDRFFIQDLAQDGLPAELQHLKFDTVISTEVIEHLYNPFTFINFCKNILDDGKGQVIISTPYHGYVKNLALSLFNKWDFHTNPVAVGGHIKFWSRPTLARLLNGAGFTVTHFKGCGGYPYLWKSMLMKGHL